jgi:glycosyltransferase involved in cell wall biosynthesis
MKVLLVGDKLLIPLQKALQKLKVSADFLDHKPLIRRDSRLDRYRSDEKVSCSTDYDYVICFGEWVDVARCKFGKTVIYWSIDTHCYTAYTPWFDSNILHADVVFCTNYDFTARIVGKPAYWMPVFNWVNIQKLDIEPKYDVVFLGSYNSSRQKYLDVIKRNVESVFFSDNCWGEERDIVLNSARLVFNPPLSESSPNLAVRVLFTLAIGKCQLLKSNNPNIPFLQDGVHYIGYSDPVDIVDKIRFLLDNPKERARIERNALRESEKHTAEARAVEILKVLRSLD